MLSVRPRELRLVIQHHEAAMRTISCSSFYRFFNITPAVAVHTSVTAVTTDSTVTAVTLATM